MSARLVILRQYQRRNFEQKQYLNKISTFTFFLSPTTGSHSVENKWSTFSLSQTSICAVARKHIATFVFSSKGKEIGIFFISFFFFFLYFSSSSPFIFSFFCIFPYHFCFVSICIIFMGFFILPSVLSIIPCLFPVNVCWPVPVLQTSTAELAAFSTL